MSVRFFKAGNSGYCPIKKSLLFVVDGGDIGDDDGGGDEAYNKSDNDLSTFPLLRK